MRKKLTAFAVPSLFAGVIALSGGLVGLAASGAGTPPRADSLAIPDSTAIPTASLRIPPIEEILRNPRRLAPLPPDLIDTETLWLARCIFSESKRPEEQELIAWVVRNRVETQYRGRQTYRDVVLDPYQFSAFRPGYYKRDFYMSLTPESNVPGWQRALWIAHYVRHAPDSLRPFSLHTRHFYSERSLGDVPHPNWALGREPIRPNRRYEIDERRFRFFEGVS
ncbi:cell wall hydrolase [Rhodocaloribacter litoris]|uniref:cell wall hydrolase n=1 Tax=Rhodocaloribacter litoris TaxID=2558931 RepID=UPI001E3F57FE|nr:cell wall hydrolase [Rhodocaloribacter litoris]QXD14559.1 cell wall hydrolase [Rhodocaloribacter litoris]